MEEKQGIPLVQWAVTNAAMLLAQLRQHPALDDRDRKACEDVFRLLERAEKVLYGK